MKKLLGWRVVDSIDGQYAKLIDSNDPESYVWSNEAPPPMPIEMSMRVIEHLVTRLGYTYSRLEVRRVTQKERRVRTPEYIAMSEIPYIADVIVKDKRTVKSRYGCLDESLNTMIRNAPEGERIFIIRESELKRRCC
jgi:hypothetical protein